MRQGQNNKYQNLLSFIDLLFNICLGFAAMFLLSMAMINSNKNENEGVKKDVEYFIRIEWQGNHDSDVDMWIQDPTGDIVGYKDKQRNHMYLERDNLGTDTTLKNPGHINEEVISLLKAYAGWYTINLHWFERRLDQENPIVQWSLIKMKPTMQTIASGTSNLKQKGQELTAFRFKINNDGQIDQVDTIVQNMFILKKLGR